MSSFTQLEIDGLIASLATDGEHVGARGLLGRESVDSLGAAHAAQQLAGQPDVLSSGLQMSDVELNELLDFFLPGEPVDTSWHTDQMREWEQQAVERYLAEVALRESL